VEGAVRGEPGREIILYRVEHRRPQPYQVLLGTPGGGERDRRYLERLAHLHQLVDPDRGAGQQQPDPGHQRLGERRRVGLGHEAAAGDAAGGDDEVLAGQQAQGLPDGAPAHPGLGAELRLGRQPLPGS
jgi:hypothetical protein